MQNTKKIYIALCLSGGFLFSGCMTENKNNIIENSENTIDLENIVSEVQNRSAYFSLERTEENKVSLVLNNPTQHPIQSFSSEIIFPPHLVQIKNLKNTSEDIFGLYIKSDWKIDNNVGRIKIASASLGTAQKLSQNALLTIPVAQFEFEKTDPENTFIFDINENISNIFIINKHNSPEILESIVNKNSTKDLIIK